LGRTMIERNTRKLLFEAIEKTGDNPEDVQCSYSKGWPPYVPGNPLPMMPKCSASDLPEGELLTLFCHSRKHFYNLVRTDREIKIETSPNPDPS